MRIPLEYMDGIMYICTMYLINHSYRSHYVVLLPKAQKDNRATFHPGPPRMYSNKTVSLPPAFAIDHRTLEKQDFPFAQSYSSHVPVG
jgi:hypothetical protein